MAYKNILVHLNDSNNLVERLDYASKLARRYEARLTGLFVIPSAIMPAAVEVSYSDELSAAHMNIWRQRAASVKTAFSKAVETFELDGAWREFQAGGNASADIVSAQARTADLLVIGRVDDSSDDGQSVTLGRVLMAVGRPVMVLPGSIDSDALDRPIVVAWNGRSESARATFDALPMLIQAGVVHIVTIGSPSGNPAIDIPATDLADSLSRHGVTCELSNLQSGKLSVGHALLSQVSKQQAGQLVMGCYGHSRLREFVFGGTTRTILKESVVPVFMSR